MSHDNSRRHFVLCFTNFLERMASRMKVLLFSALHLREVEDERMARKLRRRMLVITKRQKMQHLVVSLLLSVLFNATTIHHGIGQGIHVQ